MASEQELPNRPFIQSNLSTELVLSALEAALGHQVSLVQ
jgi:hypothetical protein